MFEHFTRTHLSLGRIFKIPIGLNASWIAIFALVVWTLATGYFSEISAGSPGWMLWSVSVVASLLFFVSILAHEFGHALVAQAVGIPVRGITLFALGGVSRIASEPRTAREEFLIASAGPLVSLLLSVGLGALASFSGGWPLVSASATYLALVNAGLAIFNLLPALPLDGGRILRALLWAVTGNPWTAMRWSATAGRAFGISFVLLGGVSTFTGGLVHGFWFLLVGLFIESCARTSARIAREGVEQGDAALQGPAQSPGSTREKVRMDEYQSLLERVIGWRARLDTLPRPGELDSGRDDRTSRSYVKDRLEMYRLLNDADVAIRSRLEPEAIEAKLSAIAPLFGTWEEASLVTEDPGDAIVAGRPSSFAPSPEDVLAREPGSSAEV